ncbi:SMP-30/gluconolactonase/LRE family protein [Mangrovibrevibacter kandeliae]|uniref:SMP-30/gluconolactonase/LRE family protein n=1 Tax=Mangrovibrevibacter kandeliae TaxID=2968473 RepID=UPI002118EA3F|nr:MULTISPECIES: SMP-30/gluconolactonase/LRE family protein [unclassified Aurantimonas]MCQ8781549.1 SMP-30/gluconolactonase/LRE family protein [Aurantimonas sp. CSK15Z-1]MCW4114325.1 SMP-30/gluconolactonase/LRE family protein [Aurantimonas sp. MSK8Z-1]
MRIAPLSDLRCELGESPVWHETQQRLYWCDVHACTIHALDVASGEAQVWRFPSSVGSFGLARSGRLVVALRDAVVLFDPCSGTSTPIARFDFTVPGMRLNDGKVGPDGAFWIGSVHEVAFEKMQHIAALFRVSGDGSVSTHVTGLKASNGLAWSADGRTMFHSDSCGPWIDRWRFDPARGAMADRVRIAEPTENSGRPDGGAVDREGAYWSAGTSAGVLNRYGRDGAVLQTIALPLPKPTMPCFGGPDMRTLFVTSRRDMLTDEQRTAFPLSGAVLRLEVEVPGVPAFRFAD